MKRIQVDNSVRFSVYLIVDDNESYLEIHDRMKKTVKYKKLAPKQIPIKVHFYRSHWLYRWWMKLPYGHVNIELPDKTFINVDLKPEECGNLASYELTPDYTIATYAELADLERAKEMAMTPLNAFSIFRHNCFAVMSVALGGKPIQDLYRDSLKSKLPSCI